MFKLNLGINECSNREYHSDSEYLSSSDYKLLLKDPSEFYKKKYMTTEPEEKKDFFDDGSAVHSLILEPHLFNSEFAIFNGMRKQGELYQNFVAENPGKIILSTPQIERCRRMVRGYNKRLEAVQLINGGFSEHTVCINFNGVPTKVRADYINIDKGYIVDVKTTGYEADLDSFRMTCDHWDYPLSAALYTKIMEEFYGKPFIFYWLVLSKKDATCELYKMSEATRLKGDLKIAKAQKIYKQCLKSGLWISENNDIIEPTNSTYEILEI